MNQALTQQRLRITFAKCGALRFVGHLDLARTWERVLRRADIPIEYTQGFNPRPRMQFAGALQVGVTSESEYFDVWLTQRLRNLDTEWVERLNNTSPPGLRTSHIVEVLVASPALPTLAQWSEYVISPREPHTNTRVLEIVAQTLLSQTTIMRQGKKKPYDLRPRILNLVIQPEGDLIARLSTSERANARPDELLDAMGIDMGHVRVHRRYLHLANPE